MSEAMATLTWESNFSQGRRFGTVELGVHLAMQEDLRIVTTNADPAWRSFESRIPIKMEQHLLNELRYRYASTSIIQLDTDVQGAGTMASTVYFDNTTIQPQAAQKNMRYTQAGDVGMAFWIHNVM